MLPLFHRSDYPIYIMTLIIAHRGASAYAIENTLPAFALAVEQGADMLELDVRCTADQQLVVFHDETTERRDGDQRPIRTRTLADIQQSNRDGIPPIPTLEAVCQFALEQSIALNVELKEQETVSAVVALLHQYHLTETTVVSSFHAGALHALLHLAPTLQRGYIMGTRTLHPAVRLREIFPIPHLQRVQATAWHPSHQLPLLRWLIPMVRRKGYAVNVWTIDELSLMGDMVLLGATGIITNVPDVARGVCQQTRG